VASTLWLSCFRRDVVNRSAEALQALRGVHRTSVWTLHCRAAFAEQGVIDDPHAVRIRDGLTRDHALDLRRAFGPPAKSFAIRARVFDEVLQSFLCRHPGAEVVSLGEGLETQRFRVEGYERWTSVDVESVIRLRERFIEPDPRHVHRIGSATDLQWLRNLQPGPLFVVAQGLFMYLDPRETADLFRALEQRGDVTIMFDVVPPWVALLSRLRPPLGRSLRLPTMSWGVRADRIAHELEGWLDRDVDLDLHDIPLPTILGAGTAAAVVCLGAEALAKPTVVETD